jgi:hypothetical protein
MSLTKDIKVESAAPILVVALGPLQASVTLFFDLLPLSVRHLARVIFAGAPDVKAEIIQAQAVVFVRGLVEYEELIAFAKNSGVPMYHYCDDNYIVVGEESERYGAAYAFYTRENVRRVLTDFAGCLLSVPNLVDFYRLNALHANLYLFPPIAAFAEYGEAPHDYPAARPFTLSFFGGGDRHRAFVDYIVPAVQRLSKNQEIDLVAFGVALGAVDCSDHPKLRVFYPPYEPDYTLAIRQFRHYAPDVMLHSSSPTRNNAYKNCNNIINGVLVGAAMICSRTEPYLGLDEVSATLLADDSAESWYLALWQFANSSERLQQFKRGAKTYCEQMYSGIDNKFAINELTRLTPLLDDAALAARWVLALAGTAETINICQRELTELTETLRDGASKLATGELAQHAIRTELHLNAERMAAARSACT